MIANPNRIALVAVISLAVGGFAVAQAQDETQTPTEDTQTSPSQQSQNAPTEDTSPSTASSPHQRETTKSQSQEAPTGNGGEPESASSPHQRQATGGSMTARGDHDKMMKDCIKDERAKDSQMSKKEAKKTCEDRMMKMSSAEESRRE